MVTTALGQTPAKPTLRLPPGWEVLDTTRGHGGWARRVRDPDTGIVFILVEPGGFQMGSPKSESGRDDDETRHEVWITKAFYLAETEVTQGQWEGVMGSTPWKGNKWAKSGTEHAASYLSWEDAKAFLKKAGAGYGLPSEAQWEYACRAGSPSLYCFGNDEGRLGDYGWYEKNAEGVGEDYAHRVKRKKANAWGFHDMHGNVYEWCEDWYDKGYYGKSSETDPVNTKPASYRARRGGCFRNRAKYRYLRCSNRSWGYPSSRGERYGFRPTWVIPFNSK